MMTDWVPVMAPPELAARFLREVADYVGRSERPDPRLWEDAVGADIKEFMSYLNDQQRKFVVSLAFAEKPASAASHAARIGGSVDDIAGLVGPINKRAKKLGWMSPIGSHRACTGSTTEKVVVLDDHLAIWVKHHYEEAHA